MIYAFGDSELDLRRYQLRRDGVVSRIEPQAFDVLALLVREFRNHLLPERDPAWPQFIAELDAFLDDRVDRSPALGDGAGPNPTSTSGPAVPLAAAR